MNLKKTEEGSGWLAGRQVGSWAGNMAVSRHVGKPAGTDSGRRAASKAAGMGSGTDVYSLDYRHSVVQACAGRKSK